MSPGRPGRGEDEPYRRRPGDDLVEPLFGALPGEAGEEEAGAPAPRPGLLARLRRGLSGLRARGASDDGAWFACPVGGAEVRAGARFCRECGSDDSTGWSDATQYDDLDLPEPEPPLVPDTFEEFTRPPSNRRDASRRLLLALLAIALLLIAARSLQAILAS